MTARLSVQDLRVWLDTARGPVSIVDGVSFEVAPGQVFGLAGESGSGKTITALAVLGLLPGGARAEGAVLLEGRDLASMGSGERRRTRGRDIAMVFQDPMASLHPMLTIERQLTARPDPHPPVHHFDIGPSLEGLHASRIAVVFDE